MNYVKNLSLAQKLGIMPRPDLPLGLNDWQEIENKYLNRTEFEREH